MSRRSVKGTRDFCPEEVAIRNWFFEKWRALSLGSGFGAELSYRRQAVGKRLRAL